MHFLVRLNLEAPMASPDFQYSRTPWQGNEHLIKKIRTRGKIGRDGYLNVAPELGLSGRRGKMILDRLDNIIRH